MAGGYDNTNRGVLFKNNRKEKDTHPDFTGNANFNGVEVWLNGWRKEKDGNSYISLSLKEKEARAEAPSRNTTPARRPAPQSARMDDEIPF